MKRVGWLLACATIWLGFGSPATAQEDAPPQVRLSQERLDGLVSSIALYPDVLLSQVLNAVTYPEDLAEAASWSAQHGSRQGEAALFAVMAQPWDASVKSLVPFPRVLSSVSARSEWAAELARAFLSDEQAVLESIQRARRKACAEGALKGVRVERRGQDLAIDSAMELPRWLVYGGFDWRDRQTHIVSIRIDWLGHGALLGREHRANKPDAEEGEPDSEEAAPKQLAYVKPPPLVDLAPAAPKGAAIAAAADRAPPVRQQPVSLQRPPPLVGLGGPQPRDLPAIAPEPAKQASKAGALAEEEPGKPLIPLMPDLLKSGAAEALPKPVNATAGAGPTNARAPAPAPAVRQRVVRTFIGAADRRTLESLATALRR